uniref:kinesin-like protein KIF11-B n=1 Tax=Monopterus albus TaxID=43700 RepID=UPI0009B449B4|nr:kinesin-like protein KIF11-B [Monopterus albus]
MTGCCSHLHDAVSALVERDLEWSSSIREHAELKAQEHASLLGQISTEAQMLHQSIHVGLNEQRRAAEEELAGLQEEVVKGALTTLQNQTSRNRVVLDQQQAEVRDHMETSQKLVHSFLQDELQQDVPTGK